MTPGMLKLWRGRMPLAAALALGWAGAAAAAAAEPSYDTYGSWLIACDNGLTCEAKGFEDGVAERPDLRLSRAAGPDAATTVTLTVPFTAERDAVRVDGRPLSLAAPAWTVKQEDGLTTFAADQPAAVADMLSRIRDAATLQVGTEEEGVVPLAGMMAALLRMDERQGRLDGVTALVPRGTAPAAQVPAAPPLPAVPRFRPATALSEAQGNALIRRAKLASAARFKAEECEENDAQEADATGAFALDERNALVILPCGMGAYQGWSLVSIVPRTANGAPVPFRPVLPFRGNTPENSLTEPYFDPDTGILVFSAKGRGLADCGITAEWSWDGRQFQLRGAAFQDACGGSQPGDWPTLYRSR